MNYQVEVKQIVKYPRCRMYREFINSLIAEKSIRTNGGSFLFYYIVLCSYANYRSSYRRLEHITYYVGPGEWICRLAELQQWFRCQSQRQAVSIMEAMQDHHFITYSILGNHRLVKFKINDWSQDNTVLEYNYPCKKEDGFFFFRIDKAHELISMGKCSEMDALLDLWIHTVYNDPSVQGSSAGPVVYYRDNTGNPLTSFQLLGERWHHSKTTASRIVKKLEQLNQISLISFKGKHGSMIYLNHYLSVMFEMSDVMIDKEEIAMTMRLPLCIQEEPSDPCVPESVNREQISVSKHSSCVPVSHLRQIVQKVAELLNYQAIPCCKCPKTRYILSPLSACRETVSRYILQIICPYGNQSYRFQLAILPEGQNSGMSGPDLEEHEWEGGEVDG